MHSTPNKAKISLQSYLKRISIQKADKETQSQITEELLKRMLFYVRNSQGLHLGWHRKQCADLFDLTIQEAIARNSKDPLIISIINYINERCDSEEAKKLLLDSIERALDGNDVRNRDISRAPRNRPPHPLKKMLKDVISKNPRKNHTQHTDILLRQGLDDGLIDYIEHSCETVHFKDPKIKPVKFSTIRDWFYQ